jgi:hypothetical protein
MRVTAIVLQIVGAVLSLGACLWLMWGLIRGARATKSSKAGGIPSPNQSVSRSSWLTSRRRLALRQRATLQLMAVFFTVI